MCVVGVLAVCVWVCVGAFEAEVGVGLVCTASGMHWCIVTDAECVSQLSRGATR